MPSRGSVFSGEENFTPVAQPTSLMYAGTNFGAWVTYQGRGLFLP